MTTNHHSPQERVNFSNYQKTGGKTMPEKALSKTETEAIIELLNTSLGGSAALLTSLLEEQVFVTSPTLAVTSRDAVFGSIGAPFYVALGEYTGSASGMQVLAVSKKDMDAALTATEDQAEFQAVQELISKMFDSVAQSMSTLLEKELAYSLSGMDVVDQKGEFSLANFTKEQWFTESEFQLNVSGKQNIRFYLCLPLPLAKTLVEILTAPFNPQELKETSNMPKQSDDGLNEQAQTTPIVQNVQFSSFDNTETAPSTPNNLNMLLDIPLQVTVELGRTKRVVKEILEISQGSIIELDKLAGEPVDILINNKLIAVGEVVVIDENFGVRVTDVLSTAERISKLR